MKLLKTVKEKIIELLELENSISEERKEILLSLAEYISSKVNERKETNLIFICTHNSRRSTMSQIWGGTAAEYFRIPNIKCYSGGTETTAFNPRAVKAVQESGFIVEQIEKSNNPIYLVTYSEEQPPIKCFSKIYSNSFNPQKEFAAIMTCSDADKNCPIIFGAETRFPIRYDDPKEYDGTDVEAIKYIGRFEQIGIETLFLFKNVKAQIEEE